VSSGIREAALRIDVAIENGLFPPGTTRQVAYNWRSRGVPLKKRGKKIETCYLEWFMISGMVFTTFEAIQRWLEKTGMKAQAKGVRFGFYFPAKQ
jgi:hypothetical protein